MGQSLRKSDSDDFKNSFDAHEALKKTAEMDKNPDIVADIPTVARNDSDYGKPVNRVSFELELRDFKKFANYLRQVAGLDTPENFSKISHEWIHVKVRLSSNLYLIPKQIMIPKDELIGEFEKFITLSYDSIVKNYGSVDNFDTFQKFNKKVGNFMNLVKKRKTHVDDLMVAMDEISKLYEDFFNHVLELGRVSSQSETN